MQTFGGTAQSQEACGARGSQNGAMGVERDTGEILDAHGFFCPIFQVKKVKGY